MSELELRLATASDIPVLVGHRRKMFEDMAASKGEQLDRAGLDAMDNAYAALLRYEIPAGSTRVWVIEDSGQVAASGALKFTDWLPRPDGFRRGLGVCSQRLHGTGLSSQRAGAACPHRHDRLLP
jgi:hypothetical protein